MDNTRKYEDISANDDELKKLYDIYLQVQQGDKTALNELFKTKDSKQICTVDEINKAYRLSRMDNILDSELVLDNEKNNQEKEWLDSVHSSVAFQFPCLNKMLYKKKKKFIRKAKSTGYENGKRIKNNSYLNP